MESGNVSLTGNVFGRYEWGDDWYAQGPRRLIARAMDDFQTRPDEQPVVLSQILMDRVNIGYEGLTPAEVVSFNGTRVLNLQHLREMVLNCSEHSLRFELEQANGCTIVLERQAARDADARILETYLIPAKSSSDLTEPEA